MVWGYVLGAMIGAAGGMAIQKSANKAAVSAEKRNQEYLEQSKLTDLTKLRESAEKAGFNPLTALRSGAGNFQSNTAILPSMSGYQFAVEAMSQGVNSAVQYATTYKERALDALYKTTSIQSMQADIALTKSKLNGLGQKQDPYAGYTKKIPINFGDTKFEMPLDMAKRLGIEPNANLSFGEMAELFGENFEIPGAFMSGAQEIMYSTTVPKITFNKGVDKQSWSEWLGVRGGNPRITDRNKSEIGVIQLPEIVVKKPASNRRGGGWNSK